MTFDRRTFLRSSSLAALAAGLVPDWASAAASGPASASVRSLALSDADRTVLSWVQGYSSRVRMAGGVVMSKIRGGTAVTRILAEVDDLGAFNAALAGALPFSGLYARNNTLSFTYQGTSYIIENLLPEIFAAQLKKLNAAKRVSFAHEALSYDPATQKVSDPLGAVTSKKLKIVYAGTGLAEAFRTLLRAWSEASELNLTLGPGFAQLKRRVLAVRGNREGLAKAVVATLVEQLTALSGVLSSEEIESLLRSPLVSAAISRVLGANAAAVIVRFAVLRQQLTGDDADAVAWLASLLQKQLTESTLPDWLSGLDALKAYKAQMALAEARQLVPAI